MIRNKLEDLIIQLREENVRLTRERDDAEAKLERVIEIHEHKKHPGGGVYCIECRTRSTPCATIATIAAAKGGE